MILHWRKEKEMSKKLKPPKGKWIPIDQIEQYSISGSRERLYVCDHKTDQFMVFESEEVGVRHFKERPPRPHQYQVDGRMLQVVAQVVEHNKMVEFGKLSSNQGHARP